VVYVAESCIYIQMGIVLELKMFQILIEYFHRMWSLESLVLMDKKYY